MNRMPPPYTPPPAGMRAMPGAWLRDCPSCGVGTFHVSCTGDRGEELAGLWCACCWTDNSKGRQS